VQVTVEMFVKSSAAYALPAAAPFGTIFAPSERVGHAAALAGGADEEAAAEDAGADVLTAGGVVAVGVAVTVPAGPAAGPADVPHPAASAVTQLMTAPVIARRPAGKRIVIAAVLLSGSGCASPLLLRRHPDRRGWVSLARLMSQFRNGPPRIAQAPWPARRRAGRSPASGGRRTVIGGHDYEVPAFTEFLPHELRPRVAGTFSVDTTTAPAAEIRSQAAAVLQRYEQGEERKMVETALAGPVR